MKKEEKLNAEEKKAMSEILVLKKPNEEYSSLIQDNSEYGMLTVGNEKSDLKLELEHLKCKKALDFTVQGRHYL